MKLSILADTFFYALATFILSFSILRFYTIAIWLCFSISVAVMLLTGLLVFLITTKKYRKKTLTKKEQNNKDALMLHLTLDTAPNIISAFHQAYLANECPIIRSNDQLYLNDKIITPLFTMEAVSADQIALLIRKHGTKFILLCNTLSPEAKKLLDTFHIKYTLGNDVYKLFRDTKTIPSPLICGEIPHNSIKRKLRFAFSKQNARRFFVSGSLLLIMSTFAVYPLYYFISGISLLICAIFIRFLGFSDTESSSYDTHNTI